MWEHKDFLLLIWSEYWWLSFHGAQTGQPTHFIPTAAFLPPQEDCTVLHEQRQLLNCRLGQDKIWTRLHSISVLLPCQNAIHKKTENWIYALLPNSPPMQQASVNCWHSVLLHGGSWRESLEQRSRNWYGLVPALPQLLNVILSKSPPFWSSVFPSVKWCLSHHFFMGGGGGHLLILSVHLPAP